MNVRKDPYADYPEHFLAESPEEAERIFTEHSPMLNGIAYTYSVSTGIEKGELFGEAVMGLARARKNYNENLGFTFKTFAASVIRSTLDTFVRKNSYSVNTPAYIKRAHSLVVKFKRELDRSGVEGRSADKALRDGNLSSLDLPTKIVDECEKIIELIKREADRASTNYASLVDRSEFLPMEVELTDSTIEARHNLEFDERNMEIALFVEKLKNFMTNRELAICEGIMADRTYDSIAKDFGKTKPWIHQQLAKLRKKLERRLKDGTITL